MDEFISYQTKAPELTQEIQDLIAHDRKELAGDFCRGCGYCMPCPKGIQINQCARMSLMLRRAPASERLISPPDKAFIQINPILFSLHLFTKSISF